MPSHPTFAPLFKGDWKNVLMVHFAVPPETLADRIPQALELDTYQGKAFITLVAFRQENLRFANLGNWAKALTWPLANHAFLNLRTYVRLGNERGIHFLTEFVDNVLARATGPLLYGLPYKFSKIEYTLDTAKSQLTGRVEGRGGRFHFQATIEPHALAPAAEQTEAHFLHERYKAYNRRGNTILKFQVGHAPWEMRPAQVEFDATGQTFDWLEKAEQRGAYFTQGFEKVELGRPIHAEQ